MQNPPIGWFFAPGVLPARTDDAPVQFESHGTCVASKAVGAEFGVSKNSNLIVLKASYAIEDFIWAFFKAHKNILDKGPQTKAVIIFAFAADLVEEDYAVLRLKEIMGYLFEIDAVIVVPAGNYAQGSPRVDTVPGIWESSNFPLIVVGAVEVNGLLTADSQRGPHIGTNAPGQFVSCAKKDAGSQLSSGTSPATGMVSTAALHSVI